MMDGWVGGQSNWKDVLSGKLERRFVMHACATEQQLEHSPPCMPDFASSYAPCPSPFPAAARGVWRGQGRHGAACLQ